MAERSEETSHTLRSSFDLVIAMFVRSVSTHRLIIRGAPRQDCYAKGGLLRRGVDCLKETTLVSSNSHFTSHQDILREEVVVS